LLPDLTYLPAGGGNTYEVLPVTVI